MNVNFNFVKWCAVCDTHEALEGNSRQYCCWWLAVSRGRCKYLNALRRGYCGVCGDDLDARGGAGHPWRFRPRGLCAWYLQATSAVGHKKFTKVPSDGLGLCHIASLWPWHTCTARKNRPQWLSISEILPQDDSSKYNLKIAIYDVKMQEKKSKRFLIIIFTTTSIMWNSLDIYFKSIMSRLVMMAQLANPPLAGTRIPCGCWFMFLGCHDFPPGPCLWPR